MAVDIEYYRKKARKHDEEEYQKIVSSNRNTISTKTTPNVNLEDDDRKWFQKGLFEDGWQAGDLLKTIKASLADVGGNAGTGVIGMGETIADTLASIGTILGSQQMNQNAQNELIYNVVTGKNTEKNAEDVIKKYDNWQKEAKKGTEEFIKKDLYDEKAVANKIITAPLEEWLDVDTETESVFGEKSDALVQSAGQLGATALLSATGVPWWLTTGLTSFGGETENALNQGATFEEATISGLISAGAEILTEKISGGIKFGGKTLDDALTKKLAANVSNKVLQTMFKFGIDAAGEGGEEVLSGVMSAVGQKLTYADDKELNELFSSEDAWESFIGGAVLGGFSNVGNNIKSNVKGVDALSGLTTNEKAVFDKVYKDTIAEREKGGEKLTAKEKTKIYDDVLNKLEKGYISTDTIESVLGGETYKQYQTEVDNEKALQDEKTKLQNELKTLEEASNTIGNAKKYEATENKLAEVESKLKEFHDNSKVSQLKGQLSNEVSELAKNSRLAESYNEKSRKSQAFEADLSKYDEKQRSAVKRAIDSGILNNTNRTHEFVDLIAKLEADKGVPFDFINNEKLKASGFAIEGKEVAGYVQGKNIAINIDSAKALNTVVGHEITHILEGTELYPALQDAVKIFAESKGEYNSKLQSITKMYEGIEDANIENELTAELVGDYLFSDTNIDFIKNLSVEQPGVFQKIYDEVKYLCKVANTRSKEAKELEKVKKTFAEVYRQKNNTATDNGAVKYSFNDTKTGMANDKLMPYDEELTSIIEQKGGYIIDSYEKLENVVNLAFDNPQQKATAYFGILSPDVLSNIEKNIPNLPKELSGTLFKKGKGYSITTSFDNIRHLVEDKGSLTSNDIITYLDRLADTIADFDTVNFDYYYDSVGKKNNGILFKKQFEDGVNITFNIVSNKKRSLNLITAYMDKADYKKKKSAETLLMQNAPAHTLEAGVGQTSTNIISTPTENVKDVFGYKINQDAEVNEDLLEDMSYYHPDAEVDTLGNITVYHRTTKANAEKIKQTGVMTAKEDALFFSSKESGYASDYGDTVVKMKIPSTELRLNDVFDGEVHFDLPLKYKNGGYSLDVSKYIIDNTKFSLVDGSTDIAPEMNNNIYGEDVKLKIDDVPIKETASAETTQSTDNTELDIPDLFVKPKNTENEQTVVSDDVASVQQSAETTHDDLVEQMSDIMDETPKSDAKEELPDYFVDSENKQETKLTRKALHSNIIEGFKSAFVKEGIDLDETLNTGKRHSALFNNDNTPQRVLEKTFGYKAGKLLADLTINKIAQNETEGIKWLNSYTGKKGLLRKLSKEYNIKPGSNESAAAHMYLEGFYVNESDEYVRYGDVELAADFPDRNVRENIRLFAKDPRVREFYDLSLNLINEGRVRNAYDPIPRRDNYALHFRAMDDFFSRIGVPLNPNDIKAKDLPTDLNGVTVDLKPGQPYFASAKHRIGVKTTYDLLGGMERYANSAKNQIFHIDDIQNLRALRNYIADTFGQAKGLEGIDELTADQAKERIEQVYSGHLSNFAMWLNEEANHVAGKTALMDRAVEGMFGRRGLQFLSKLNGMVGSNQVGLNISSSLTNIIPVVQTFARTNKYDFAKAFSQTVLNTARRRSGNDDGFAEKSPVMIRRKGAESFAITPYQKATDAGYAIMSAVDGVATELIARTKFNEYTRKGMSEQKAHIETDKWVSRLMGDRSLGQQPLLYNSKTLGLFTKYQLEVRNQLDSMFYDTIQETKEKYENIESNLVRNAKTAAKYTATLFELAVAQHFFGTAFESMAGYNPAFDIIEVILTACGHDDDEDSEDTTLDNLEQAFFELLGDLPYSSLITGGGRIPISSALPIQEVIMGKDQNGYDLSKEERVLELLEALPYYLLPTGYGQLKKTFQGLSMFDDDLPIAGSYTDSGKLRYSVDETLGSMVQAGLFGQYANKNARDYFDNDRAPLKEKQIEEFIELDIPIQDYWEYREGLSDLGQHATLNEKGDYIGNLDLPVEKKNILINNIADRDTPIDLSDFDKYQDFEEFDFATRYPEKYAVLQEQGISVKEYKEIYEETAFMYTDDFSWASNNPEKYTLSKAVTDDVMMYKQYTSDLYNIEADKDKNGKSISGSKKKKVTAYINDLDIDYGAKLILFKSQYKSDDRYNSEIVDYLNSREDITRDEIITILTELDFTVYDDGTVRW